MGFMAGFGSAFADSFRQQEQITAAHKEDVFRLRYQDYISRRDTQVKEDKENAKMAKMAKQAVALTGQPEEAWGAAYDLFQGGASFDDVVKMMQNNQAVIQPNSPTTTPGEDATASDQPVDPRDELTTGAASAVGAQMEQSGMKAPADGGIFGKIKSAIGGHSQDRAARDQQRADEEIANTTGDTPEQVQSTFQGRDPGEPIPGMPDATIKWTPKTTGLFDELQKKATNRDEAVALEQWTKVNGTPEQQQYATELVARYNELKKNEIAQNAYQLDPSKAPQRGMVRKKDGTGYEDQFVTADYSDGDPLHPRWLDDKGQEVDPKTVAPVGMNQEKDMKAIADEASEDSKPVAEARVAQKNMIRTGNDYLKLLKDNKGKFDSKAMDISGNLTQFLSRWKRAGVNIADLVRPPGNIDDANANIAALEKEERKIRTALTSGKFVDRLDETAAKASLIDIQGTKLAYMMAAQANGGPKGVSNQDFQKWKEAVSGNGNPATAAKALQMSIDQGNKTLGDMEAGVKKGRGAASIYKGKYKGAPTGYDYGQSFDEEIKSDPELSEAVKNISLGASLEDNPGAQLDTSDPRMADVPDIVKQNKAVDFAGNPLSAAEWIELPTEIQEALKKKNGM